MRYDGGKGQAGVYQRIISLMPPHEVYIETHLGGGNILERKRPALKSIGLDIDRDVIDLWRVRAPGLAEFYCTDAVTFLRRYDFTGRELVYCDPPYVMKTRRGGRIYKHEYTDEQHHELLDVVRDLPCRVVLSGYRCEMYDAALTRWQREDFRVKLRGSAWADESLWFNFEPPTVLHDYRYVGGNFRERERIKRKRARWSAKFAKLPAAERNAMMEVLLELGSLDPAMAPGHNADTAAPVTVRAKRRQVVMPALPSAFPFSSELELPGAIARKQVDTSSSSAASARANALYDRSSSPNEAIRDPLVVIFDDALRYASPRPALVDVV